MMIRWRYQKTKKKQQQQEKCLTKLISFNHFPQFIKTLFSQEQKEEQKQHKANTKNNNNKEVDNKMTNILTTYLTKLRSITD